MAEQPYNARAHVQSIKRGNSSYSYMAVKDRVIWFRETHPDGVIQCDVVQADFAAGYAVVKAIISAPGIGLGEGLGSCSRQELAGKIDAKAAQPDQAESWIEYAETAAIGRALAHLGYGTEAAMLEAGPVDAPTERQAPRPPASARQPAPTAATTHANAGASDSPLKRAKKACWAAVAKLYPDEEEALGVLGELLRTSSNRMGATLEAGSLTDWEKLAGELANGKIAVPAPEPAALEPLF